MLDHVSLGTSDFTRSARFYEAALAPLGIKRLMERAGDDGSVRVAGYGDNQFPYFWLGRDDAVSGRLHIAFRAPSREAVNAFHAAALGAGGCDNGAPGLRPEYHSRYYGAFVLDPDGVNVEAVHHGFGN